MSEYNSLQNAIAEKRAEFLKDPSPDNTAALGKLIDERNMYIEVEDAEDEAREMRALTRQEQFKEHGPAVAAMEYLAVHDRLPDIEE